MDYRIEHPEYYAKEEGFSDAYKEGCGYFWDDELQDWLNEDLESWNDALEWECIAAGCNL